LSKNRFQQESELLEAGFKTSLMDNQLFIGAAIFEQTRSNLQLDGSIEEFTTEGFEIEGNYQPNRNFFMTLAMSILDSSVNGPSFDVNNTSPFLPDQVPNFFLPAVDASGNAIEYRRQGVPKTTLNGLVSYKWDNGFGVQLAGYYTTEINNNVAGSLVIPDQYNLDLTFVYTAEDWEVRLAILNVTDEENWAAPNAVYGGESIFAEQPIRAELTGTWKF
jgi:outer membrane receptor protein involved in Fe transport